METTIGKKSSCDVSFFFCCPHFFKTWCNISVTAIVSECLPLFGCVNSDACLLAHSTNGCLLFGFGHNVVVSVNVVAVQFA